MLHDDITVDGYRPDASVRVQSHVNDDHMGHFNRSKSAQHIICSAASKDLLIAELGGDLPFRGNVEGIPMGWPKELDDATLTLYPSGHILGSAQVTVKTKFGVVGYSGDFGYPLDFVPKVDALVLDATYGSPTSKALNTREQVVEYSCGAIFDALSSGPVCLAGTRGALHSYLEEMSKIEIGMSVPIICSTRRWAEIEVYRNHGLFIGDVALDGTDEAERLIKDGYYIRVISKGDSIAEVPLNGRPYSASFVLNSKCRADDDPVSQLASNLFVIAYSNHGDFDATIDYVHRSGASFVLTDGSRSPRQAAPLAKYLQTEIGVKSTVSVHDRFDLY
jgi:hypothetical protein